jgi:hypothetical protein
MTPRATTSDQHLYRTKNGQLSNPIADRNNNDTPLRAFPTPRQQPLEIRIRCLAPKNQLSPMDPQLYSCSPRIPIPFPMKDLPRDMNFKEQAIFSLLRQQRMEQLGKIRWNRWKGRRAGELLVQASRVLAHLRFYPRV